jgi:hypothetical protein
VLIWGRQNKVEPHHKAPLLLLQPTLIIVHVLGSVRQRVFGESCGKSTKL